MQVARINANGLNQIAEALGRHHKLGRDHFTPAMLSAWAADAEDHFNDGNGCYFEIRSVDSISGAPVVVTITPDGYDVEEVNDEQRLGRACAIKTAADAANSRLGDVPSRFAYATFVYVKPQALAA